MHGCRRSAGFTLVELVTILVLVGILAAVAIPRFVGQQDFDALGFHDETLAALRYAQKAAIAQHRYVCVAVTAANISLSQGASSACGGTLVDPATGSSFSKNAPSGVTLSAASFYFDALGKPYDALGNPLATHQSISVSGGVVRTITVEAETGYVH